MANRHAKVTFGVLGPLEVTTEGDTLELGSPQVRVIVAALLVDPNVVVSADRLIEALWGDRASGARVELGAEARVPVALVARPGRRRRDRDAAPGTWYTSNLSASTPPGSRRWWSMRRTCGVTATRPEAVRLVDEASGLWRGPAFGEFAFSEFARARRLVSKNCGGSRSKSGSRRD